MQKVKNTSKHNLIMDIMIYCNNYQVSKSKTSKRLNLKLNLLEVFMGREFKFYTILHSK